MPPQLNEAQARAVHHLHGPLLVLAGAGSGKTRVITERIAQLLRNGIPAGAICALTFTNKAAAEMRERIARVLGESVPGDRSRSSDAAMPSPRRGAAVARAITISTFHSFGLDVLSKEREALGGRFVIFDQGDALSTVKDLLRSLSPGKQFDAASILARISNAKNAFLDPAAWALEPDSDEYDGITKEVFPQYVARLRQYRAFDFDDLVCETARLWQRREDVLAKWRARYTFLLVDEYQDTNRAQFELLRLLAAGHRNLCVVGDDDQSIYGWRGADVRNILDFESHFPGATIVKLEENYRSRAPILDVANAVISKRSDAKYRKQLFTSKPGGLPVLLRIAQTPEAEATFVARSIRAAIRDDGLRPGQAAVLYRSNAQAKLIEDGLREEGIPYRVVGGQQFYERKEVKDVLAYLRVALFPTDELSLRRIINYPVRGIGEASVEKLSAHALARGWSLWEAVCRVDDLDDVGTAARQGCAALEAIVRDTERAIRDATMDGAALVRDLVARIGLRADLERGPGGASAATKRWASVEGLVQTFARRDARLRDERPEGTSPSGAAMQTRDLASFMQALLIDFGASDEDESTKDVVTLSTLHGAKGLEFDLVHLIGCEEGFLPHQRTLDTRITDVSPDVGGADIEEERRLFYVGITRARERLVLSRAATRVVRGKPMPRTPSRFLSDIPEQMLDVGEISSAPVLDPRDLSAQADAILAMLGSMAGPTK